MNDISKFLSAWTDAERTRDTAFLEANLTDDFAGIGPLGFALPKPAWIGRHQSGDLRYETFDLTEIDARLHGQVAIVTARQDAIGTFQGNPLPQALRNTFVLVGNGQSWQLAHLQMSFIAGTPGAPTLPGIPVHDNATEQGAHEGASR